MFINNILQSAFKMFFLFCCDYLLEGGKVGYIEVSCFAKVDIGYKHDVILKGNQQTTTTIMSFVKKQTALPGLRI